ncbi:MAG: lamin tail domain-containing protein [Methanophagales archaeon]|nr:lamin tail domain-containing protein [Methanophagales archaeon]
MTKEFANLGISIIFMLLLALASVPVVNAEIANHVVISEVYVDAINETGNNRSEFVELYNPTSTGIQLDDWNLTDLEGTIALSSTIPAYGFYLIGMKGYNDYKDNATWPDADKVSDVYSFQLANDGDEVILKNSTGGIVDTVGWGTAMTNETMNAAKPGEGKSLQRRVNATITQDGYGPAWDSNNNSADFFIQDSPNPQNSTWTVEHRPLPPVPELPSILLLAIGLITLAGYVLLTKKI